MNFIVHVHDQYDYMFNTISLERQQEFFDVIKECYFNKTNKNLPIYGVPGQIDSFMTCKKDVKDFINVTPPERFRIKDEDIYEPIKTNELSHQEELAKKNSDLTIEDDDYLPKS